MVSFSESIACSVGMRQSIPRLLSSMLIPLVCLRMIEVVALVLEPQSQKEQRSYGRNLWE